MKQAREFPFSIQTKMEVSDETLAFTCTETGLNRPVDGPFSNSSRLQFFDGYRTLIGRHTGDRG
jgi:hypothetical protein